MLTRTDHESRIAAIRARLDETCSRVIARLETAASHRPAPGAWSAAQIAAHVAMVNDNLASAIDGSSPAAAPPPEGFVEREWTDIAKDVPARTQAPPRFTPPDDVTFEDGLGALRQSVARLHGAIGGLSPDRAVYCITNRVVGSISLYQAGEFAIAHMIRHNQQAKRLMESGHRG
ncbi:MAG: DinB family protein [Acidobacteriota bacterium]